MKKIKFLIVAGFITGNLFAQNTKVQTAWNYLKYDKIADAIPEIDAAAKHESTMGKEKTWYYRGLIYQKASENVELKAKYPNSLQLAYESFVKSHELNPKSEYVEDINLRKVNILNQMFQAGVESYNAKNFTASLEAFENILKLNAHDTLALINAAFSADRSNNKEKAKTYFQQLVDMKTSDPKVYLFLGGIYKAEGDTAKGLSIIQMGRQMFPNDNGLIIEELNYYLLTGKTKEAIEQLNIAIAKDETNPNLYYARGNSFDKIGNTDKAKADYLKAIELKPDYFDAIYNLGAMYFNQGADLANKANNIPPSKQKEYDEAKKKADDKFKEAMPYLEKALELNPDDRSTLISLKQLYARIGENVKYEKIKAKLDGK